MLVLRHGYRVSPMLEDTKNIANIFFFVTVGVVGILSYLQE